MSVDFLGVVYLSLMEMSLESRISLSYKIRWPNVGHGRSLCGGPSDFSHHDGVRECLTLHLEVLVLGSWEAAEPPSHWRLSALG